ncbi:hypothetical protein HY798_04720 [Candidatus Falkowbacteria bacterium]|nr:hypothetical protein [Candidatus Falkowbacteria bacterium]
MDTEKAIKFLNKLSELPMEAQLYLDSVSLGNFTEELNEKYNIPVDYFIDLEVDFIIGDLNLFRLPDKIKSDLSKNEQEAKKIACDFVGIFFLPVETYLKNYNIKKIIQDWNGNPKDYQKYLDSFIKEIEKENIKVMEEAIIIYDEFVDILGEANAAIDIFKNYLVGVLKSNYLDNKKKLNGSLIMLLNKKEDKFKKELENALYSNQEKLTAKEFILTGPLRHGDSEASKPQAPTIANWLKDFIKTQGSGMFDELALSKYLIGSANAKKLDETERNLLRKLLALYRNLKFFPESLADRPPEEWEIIPTEKEEALTKVKRSERAQKSPQPPFNKGGDADARLEELRAMAAGYPAGSLERKAVEEEMRNMEVRSKK